MRELFWGSPIGISPVGGFYLKPVEHELAVTRPERVVVTTAFDFTFGLRCLGIEQLDAVEVEGRTELGEVVGVVGVEEGVVVHCAVGRSG